VKDIGIPPDFGFGVDVPAGPGWIRVVLTIAPATCEPRRGMQRVRGLCPRGPRPRGHRDSDDEDVDDGPCRETVRAEPEVKLLRSRLDRQ
jgi:hypothetical protein